MGGPSVTATQATVTGTAETLIPGVRLDVHAMFTVPAGDLSPHDRSAPIACACTRLAATAQRPLLRGGWVGRGGDRDPQPLLVITREFSKPWTDEFVPAADLVVAMG